MNGIKSHEYHYEPDTPEAGRERMSHERSISDERVEQLYKRTMDGEQFITWQAAELRSLIERLRIAERALDNAVPGEVARSLIFDARTELMEEGKVRA